MVSVLALVLWLHLAQEESPAAFWEEREGWATEVVRAIRELMVYLIYFAFVCLFLFLRQSLALLPMAQAILLPLSRKALIVLLAMSVPWELQNFVNII